MAFDQTSYQRRLARIMALPPDKQAWFAEELAQQQGEDEMRREVQGMQAANTRDAQQASLALGRDRLAASSAVQGQEMALRRSALGEEKRQNRGAEMLGYGNLALGAGLGAADIMREQERAKKFGDWAALYRP
jgi:hypothetical protein